VAIVYSSEVVFAPSQGVLSQFGWDPRRANDAAPDTVWLAEVTCIGEIDRMQLADYGSCVRSHPPVLDALTALRAQD
jgi:hypothetical protein